MDEAKLHITCLFLEENNNFKRLPVGTFHLLHNYVMTNYDIHETSFSIPVDTIRGRSKYGTTALKPGPLDVAYQIELVILRYIQIKQECGQAMTRLDVIDCANSLITGSTLVTAMNCFCQSNSKSPAREFGLTWYRNFMKRNKNKIENRRGERQLQLRKNWTTHENFVTMYDHVYSAMVDAKVATLLDESENYFINRSKSRVKADE